MNQNGKLSAQRGVGNIGSAHPSVANRAVSAAAGAAVGVAGSVGGLIGADPRRNSVPANNYGQQNKAFGKAYNITSAPGSMVAKAENRIRKAL